MSANRKIVFVIAVLLLVALACDFLPAPQGDVVATAVAGTQTAAAAVIPATNTPESTPEPTLEPPPFLQVVYVKDGDVWYWDEGGLSLQLTALGDVISVVLSDDGLVAAFVRGADYINEEIGAVNTDGTNLRTLVSLADFSTMIAHPDAISAVPNRMAWAPGTHILSFNTRMTFEGPGLIRPDELRQVNSDTLALNVLLPPGQAGDFYYSPDGSKIALVKADQISVVDADGSNRIDLLNFPIVITYSEYLYYPPVNWTPGSDALRASIPPHDPLLDPPDPTTIWHIPADGSPPSSLMTITNNVPFFQEEAKLSPNGNKVAYLVMVTPGTPPIVELHISNADGTGDVIYGSGDLQFEAWSTDAEHFIYTQSGHNPKIGRLGYPTLDYSGVTLMVGIEWVDETRFLYNNRLSASWELSLGELGAPIQVIGSTTGEWIMFDFVK